MKLNGKTRKSPRYEIYITGMDSLSLGELGGRLILKNLKNEVFLAYERAIGC